VLAGLLDPLRVRGLTLRNRIVMPPMHTGLATAEGAVTEKLINHYVLRSEALGLLIVEHSYVSLEGKLSERQVGIHNDSLILGLEKLSSSIHATGTPVVIQINHAGRVASREVTGKQPVAPSLGENARELKGEDLEALAEAFGMAAERAMRAGFDGVEVHGAHGFLLNQFFSPLTNRRSDNYGGSLENRMKSWRQTSPLPFRLRRSRRCRNQNRRFPEVRCETRRSQSRHNRRVRRLMRQ